MAKPSYQVLTLDLTQARTKKSIVDNGSRVDSVAVLSMPAGTVAALSFGTNSDDIPIGVGDTYDVSGFDAAGCPVPLDEGVFLTNPVGAGTLVLLISYGSVQRETAV